ncbi:MAG: radical SAM protein [Syntrophorhabdaceae bacterium]|nr:radical SAM protein [Syntrophorhabdaceae bacterium]
MPHTPWETKASHIENKEDGDALPAQPLKALASCMLCPRACGVNRLEGKRGFCRAGRVARVASVSLHHGEEPPISGTGGSGTIFFAHCNLACLFCQNYPISQLDNGRDMDGETLAAELLKLQARGAHNVNFVTPTPHVPQMAEAVLLARRRGFTIPVVYNSNGYDSLDALALADGVVDIYLPDAKYRPGGLAKLASGISDYAEANDAALREMARQTGFLKLDQNGIAVRGMLVRHLVLPGRVEETREVLAYLLETFGPDIPISLMGQYFPAYKAFDTPGFNRRLSGQEYDQAIEAARRLGLQNVFIQEI